MENVRNGWGPGAVVVGVAVGAAIGLMFAPKTGAELRRQMSTSARDLGRRAATIYGQATQGVNEVLAKGRTAFESGRKAYRSSRPA